MSKAESVYLKHHARLQDVIAAIQVMGTYHYSARSIEAWSALLGEKPQSATTWLTVFNEHPEFFRAGVDEDDLHTLAIRRAQPRLYDTKSHAAISPKAFAALPKDNRSHISRTPLSSGQIASLVEIAVKLHAEAVTRNRESRWWAHIAIPALTSLLGVVIGAYLSHK
jgi:hypothetical protein